MAEEHSGLSRTVAISQFTQRQARIGHAHARCGITLPSLPRHGQGIDGLPMSPLAVAADPRLEGIGGNARYESRRYGWRGLAIIPDAEPLTVHRIAFLRGAPGIPQVEWIGNFVLRAGLQSERNVILSFKVRAFFLDKSASRLSRLPLGISNFEAAVPFADARYA